MTLDSPTVDKDDVERFSRIAEEWWDENGKFKPLHRMNPMRIEYIRDKVLAHFSNTSPPPSGREDKDIRPLSGLTLLDIGCGGGLLCEPFTRLGANVTGIDASEKNITVASLHAEKMGLNIAYRHASAEQLLVIGESGNQGDKHTFPDNLNTQHPVFDIVLAMEIVEHVADVPAFLKAVAKLVKPGGIVFMSTLNRTVKSYMVAIVGAEYVLRWLPRGTHDWKKFVKPSELCAGLRREGLTIEHMTGAVFNPIKNSWKTNDRDMDVNYMVTAIKPR